MGNEIENQTTDTNTETENTTTEQGDDASGVWRSPTRSEFYAAIQASNDAAWATARRHYEAKPAPTPKTRDEVVANYLAQVKFPERPSRNSPTNDPRAASKSSTTPTSGGSAMEKLAELMLLEKMESLTAARAAVAAAAPRPTVNGRIDAEVSTIDPALTGDERARKVRDIANRHLRGVRVTATPTGEAHLGPRRGK